ncbi:MAG TPA: Slp family lipoprotein [Methylococcus sp.]|nr:Slp family lipoprotein [Methylococcus sp.]
MATNAEGKGLGMRAFGAVQVSSRGTDFSRLSRGLAGLLLASQLAACATSPVPRSFQLRAMTQPKSFVELRANAPHYTGQMVILGGEIVETRHREKISEIEVVQKNLDSQDRPEKTDRSGGRFLVQCSYFLDPAVYEKDREITVAGKVIGQRRQKLDEADYTYLVVGCDYLHLWPERQPVAYYPYPYPYWYGWPYYYYPYPYFYYAYPVRTPKARR